MTNNELISECAKLDGWEGDFHQSVFVKRDSSNKIIEEASIGSEKIQRYLTSHDAIIPVIRKAKNILIIRRLLEELYPETDGVIMGLNAGLAFDLLTATPEQLATALVKACGKWKN